MIPQMMQGLTQTNGLGMEGSAQDPLRALMEKIRRRSAYAALGIDPKLMQLLEEIIGGGGDIGDGGNGGGGGGGNTGCLAGDTLVRMADGSEKPASDIRVDDEILGWSFELDQAVPQTVTKVESSRQMCYAVVLSDGARIQASGTHPWFVSGFTQMGPGHEIVMSGHKMSVQPTTELARKVSEWTLVGEDMEPLHVASVEPIGNQVVYWWNCSPHHNYFAGGVLHHNLQPDFKPHWGPGGGVGQVGGTGQSGGS